MGLASALFLDTSRFGGRFLQNTKIPVRIPLIRNRSQWLRARQWVKVHVPRCNYCPSRRNYRSPHLAALAGCSIWTGRRLLVKLMTATVASDGAIIGVFLCCSPSRRLALALACGWLTVCPDWMSFCGDPFGSGTRQQHKCTAAVLRRRRGSIKPDSYLKPYLLLSPLALM